ncbi:TonB-dependent receptor plug domain-containing protein [Parahaliea aestuarii]|uniref:TonB-dependent receptor n=1 Tax=Parahaliea aestuarii TaxID=1852021 RepID=A0A5C8ZU24_9GAMM|nr:TonB-dependent receptor [Parahaliea aestuarii]TXS91062.1 TonB-dependent receptor [Parahaliea aestuarii]
MNKVFQFEKRPLAILLAGGVVLGTSQLQAQAAEPEGVVEEVIVTGSRLSRTGYDTPTPLTSLGSEELATQAPENIADLVNTLPSVAGSQTGTTNSGSLATGIAGISAINLRALGAGRTLVLLDGRRSPVSTSSGFIDTNTMPQGLIDRVEVVTGGASAAYGSGAVGGVVNFILDKDYEGVKTTADYGITTRGDNESKRIGFTAGSAFAGGRGHFLFDSQATDSDGIHETQRGWNKSGYYAMPNPALFRGEQGVPTFITGKNIGLSSHTIGGLVVDGPLRGTYFGEGGSINQLNYGEVGGQWMQGGDWQYTSHQAGTQSLAAADERQSFFTRASFDVNEAFSVFGEASYAGWEGYANYLRVPTLRNVIQRDNAFLSDEMAQAMDTAGVDSFLLSTANGDSEISGHNNERETYRFTAGAEGFFNLFEKDWDWDASYTKSRTVALQKYLPTIYHLERYAMATDAVIDPATGEAVCRTSLSDPDNGCVPLNIMGTGVSTPEAWDYVSGAPEREETYDMDVVAMNFRVNDITGWAGPISVAFGGEWREESIYGEVEDQYQSGWRFGNFQEDRGEFDVWESYVEALVPLGFGVDFNGGYRYADYSLSGEVETWKLGLTWQPIKDVTLRGTRSRDIRAPNLGELFATGTARGNTVEINGVIVPYQQSLQGSTELAPEVAEGWSGGIVWQPGFLPGFGASLDYYDIEVNDVIGSVSAEQVASFCFDSGIQAYCDDMVFTDPSDPTTLTTINIYYENLNSLRAEGLDLELSYDFEMAQLVSDVPGYVSLRFMATHYMENVTDNGTTAIDMAGSNSSLAGATPDWKYRATALYSLAPWTFNLTMRGVSSGVLGNDFIECSSDCPASVYPALTVDDNDVDGQVVFDAYVSRSFDFWDDSTGEVYLAWSNIFDEDPPLSSEPLYQGTDIPAAYPQTNRSIYDFLGSRFRIGVRAEF